MFGLASWFILSLSGGLLALWAIWARHISKWRSMSLLGFLCAILISGGAILLSQGWATKCSLLLPGKYDMIGYLPVPDEAIYLFLNTEYGPKQCYIPWDAGKADQLKKNEEDAGGSEFTVQWGLNEGEGEGVPGTDEGGEFSPRPKQDNHAPKVTQ